MTTASAERGELEQLWQSATLIDATVKSIGRIANATDHYSFATPLQQSSRLLPIEHYLQAEVKELAEGEVSDNPERPVSTFTVRALGEVGPADRHPWKDLKRSAQTEEEIIASLFEDEAPAKVEQTYTPRRALMLGENLELEQPYLGEDVFEWAANGEMSARTVIFGAGEAVVDRSPVKQHNRFYRLLGRFMSGSIPSIEEAADIVRAVSLHIGTAAQHQDGILHTEDLRKIVPKVIKYSDLPSVPVSYIQYDRKTQLVSDLDQPSIGHTELSTMWTTDIYPGSQRFDLTLKVDELFNRPEIDPDTYAAILEPDVTGAEFPIGIRVEEHSLFIGSRDNGRTKSAPTPAEANEMLEPLHQTAQIIAQYAETHRSNKVVRV